MKKVIKKTVAKKPIMKSGGAKKMQQGGTKGQVTRIKTGSLSMHPLTGYKGYKNHARLKANIDNQPEMHPMTIDQKRKEMTGGTDPIWFDPSGSKQKKGGAKKALSKAQTGTEVNPSFSDKVNLAVKRIGRNLTNRRSINLANRSMKLYDSDRKKSDELYNKSDAVYQKAIDKNKDINKFKREKGFERSSDGTMMTKTYSKPGPIWSKQKKGGAVKKVAAKKTMVKSKKK